MHKPTVSEACQLASLGKLAEYDTGFTLGLCLFDAELKLQVCNAAYRGLFAKYEAATPYQAGLPQGLGLEDFLRFEAEQLFALELTDTRLQERQAQILAKQPFRMRLPSSLIAIDHAKHRSQLEVSGQALDDGGYLLSYYLLAKSEPPTSVSAIDTSLLDGISHDLLQPLNAARLFNATLTQSLTDGKAKLISSNVDNALRSVEHMLSTLLSVSRLDAGRLKPHCNYFKLNEVMQILADEFQVLADDRRLNFSWVPSNVVVYSDPQLLRRILQNFLSNAMRYTPAKKTASPQHRGKVLFGARRRGAQVELQVWDNGPGIPEQQQAVIFDEFSRLQNSDQQGVKGFGLGLAIVKRMAKLLDHNLGLRSWPERGSVFSLSLAIADISDLPIKSTAEQEQQKHHTLHSLEGLNVLCIDNEMKILEAMQELIRPWGCRVYIAYGFDDAVRMLPSPRHSPDIILADYRLDDDITGLDVVRQLYQHWQQEPPCVVITGEKSATILEQISKQGLHHLAKPARPAALRALMTKLMLDRQQNETGN